MGIAHRDTGKEKVWTMGRAVRDCCSMAVVEGRVSVVCWTASVSGRSCVQIVHTYHCRLERYRFGLWVVVFVLWVRRVCTIRVRCMCVYVCEVCIYMWFVYE